MRWSIDLSACIGVVSKSYPFLCLVSLTFTRIRNTRSERLCTSDEHMTPLVQHHWPKHTKKHNDRSNTQVRRRGVPDATTSVRVGCVVM